MLRGTSMIQCSENALEPILPLWDTSIPDIPKRSQLYSLAPLGINTFFVESLTSYICRLAQEHHLQTGALIQHIIAPCISKHYISNSQSRGISSFLRYAAPINGNGVMASDWSEALATLTFRHDLSQLTLLVGADALSHRDLLQTTKQWCPTCYSEWRCQGSAVYEPLLWCINGVIVCPKHHRSLENSCPLCSSRLPWLTWYSRPGYCSNCGGWLGNSENNSKPEEKDIYISETVGSFLAYVSQQSVPIPQAGFIQSLQNLISTTTQGNVAAFARCLSLPKTTMWELVQQRFPPSLPLLLQLCFQFRFPLLALLMGIEEILPGDSVPSKVQAKKRGSRDSFDYKKILQALEDILADPESVSLSMREVARRLGYPAKTIASRFPEQCQQISRRYMEYRKQQGQIRKTLLRQRINEAVIIVRNEGFQPTYRRVGAVLGTPGCFREAEARQVLIECSIANDRDM